MDWIEAVDPAEFKREATPARRSKELKFEPRTRTTWVDLPYSLGFCEVPAHEEVMKTLNPGQLEYRDKYPTRWVIEINGVKVCRDCFLAEADKE